ncbi:hypothetical protein [Streptomyces sp. AC550_RSS872]|uniref:hypothetical protein n=1 Tax=Streptomyces sp. AC550_RSS872 TaxID=2823689 RepID=UPI001C2726B5|nr:hypothetical protein [Streptomyces sp. AC550_RSS872]
MPFSALVLDESGVAEGCVDEEDHPGDAAVALRASEPSAAALNSFRNSSSRNQLARTQALVAQLRSSGPSGVRGAALEAVGPAEHATRRRRSSPAGTVNLWFDVRPSSCRLTPLPHPLAADMPSLWKSLLQVTDGNMVRERNRSGPMNSLIGVSISLPTFDASDASGRSRLPGVSWRVR